MDELWAQRLRKLEAIRALGLEPYPIRTDRTHTAAEAVRIARQQQDADAGEKVIVAGRLVAFRDMGRAAFADIRDGTGTIQVLFRSNALGVWFDHLKLLDLGDFVECSGATIRTRTGQPSVAVTGWKPLAKAMRAPPEKYHGLSDVEARQRRRYLDLMANEETRTVFQVRSKAVSSIRRFLDGRGFLEVETPILQESAGGAAARPFFTHFNALDEDRALRISLELHLKRMLIGGFDRVYELGRIFRNEGIDTRHNPEFSMLETYQAYADYRDVAAMVESLIATVAEESTGRTTFKWRDAEIDLTPPWPRLSFTDALQQFGDINLHRLDEPEPLRAELERRGLNPDPGAGYGKLADLAMSHYVEPKLVQPTFLVDYPVELSPLAKRKADDARFVERFEVFFAGFELGNAYSELNDPIEQRERFLEQLELREAGDDEVELVDDDFLFALEHGMPPTGGFGLGVDRLIMILTEQSSIRDVILFPQHRSERG
jgi:lysyl-tRNA synthetase class 2